MAPLEPLTALPFSADAEAAILGAILVDNTRLGLARRIILPDDFMKNLHRKAYRAILTLNERGSGIDLVTLIAEMKSAHLLSSKADEARIQKLPEGVHRAANIEHYCRIVKDKSRRRSIVSAAERLRIAAGDGRSNEDLEVLFAQLVSARAEQQDLWTPSTLAGVANPDAGKVHYVVEGLLPEGEVTLVGATWKSGKTLLAYRLMLDILTGNPAYGHFAVREPLPVVIFQLEMPKWEDDRRFRRLALGCGIRPEEIPALVQEGRLVVYNRPPLDLKTAQGAAQFHRTVRLTGARVVLLDSLIAAFAGADLNDNSVVREMFTRAFGPLTSEGVSILGQHHHRKDKATGGKPSGDHAALLGAQAFGAAAGRIYALERLYVAGDTADGRRGFKARLSLTGSWTPEDTDAVILNVCDTDDGGTTVSVLTEAEQIRTGGLTTPQRAGMELARLTRAHPGILRKEALARAGEALKLQESSVKKGLGYATENGWVQVAPLPGAKHKEKILQLGPKAEDVQ
jgi:hypothetical protein